MAAYIVILTLGIILPAIFCVAVAWMGWTEQGPSRELRTEMRAYLHTIQSKTERSRK
jgi:hypothetical protein